jgi:hypothetical protein
MDLTLGAAGHRRDAPSSLVCTMVSRVSSSLQASANELAALPADVLATTVNGAATALGERERRHRGAQESRT